MSASTSTNNRETGFVSDISENTVSLEEIHSGPNYISDKELRKILPPIPVALSGYKNIRTIGMGGIGSVLSAQEPRLGREVAIKILRPNYRNHRSYLARFIREARATAQIEHPNIIPVHDCGIFDDSGIYFTMKKVVGETLRSIIHKLAKNDVEYTARYNLLRLLEILIAACNAIAFAHSRGIIHRDLKPSNIMIGDFGEVLVMDWGLVKIIDSLSDTSNLDIEDKSLDDPNCALENSISGTPPFMAPEQAAGQDDIDEKSDIYSLGSIMYSILTLEEAPVDGKDTSEVLDKVRNGNFVPPRRRAPKRNIPKELEAICMKAMSYNKNDRYDNVNDMIQDIRNYMTDYPVSAYPVPLHIHLIKFFRRRPLVPAVLLVAAVTMFTVWGLERIDASVKSISYLRMAESNIESGDLALLKAQNLYRNLSRLSQDDPGTAPEYLKHDFTRQVIEFSSRYDSAADYLKKAEEAGPQIVIDHYQADIFLKRLSFSIDTNNFEETRKLIANMRSNPKRSFYEALDSDKDLGEKVSLVMQNRGLLSIYSPVSDVDISYIQMFSRSNGKLSTENFRKLPSLPIDKMKILHGQYLMKVEFPDKTSYYYPFNIEICGNVTLELPSPETAPDGMVFVPGGKTAFFNDNTHNGNPEMLWETIDSFLIKRDPVTLGEYRKFWLTINNEAEKNEFMPKIIRNRKFYDIFDSQGNYAENYTDDHPAVGVTPKAAMAYCQWLSHKIGKKLHLPSYAQMRRAATGIAGYDWNTGIFFPTPDATANPSIFGVNIHVEQEMIQTEDTIQIINSSILPIMNNVDINETGYSYIGFRYIIPLDGSHD